MKILICFFWLMLSLCVLCSLATLQAGTGLKDSRLDFGNTSGNEDSRAPQICSDGDGHVYVVWEDGRNGYDDIYFNYSEDYGVTWQNRDIRIDTGDAPGANRSYTPQISSDSSGHVYVAWEDKRYGYKGDIYFNYSEDYGATWQASDRRLNKGDAPGANLTENVQMSSDSNGHIYVVWKDYRNSYPDIYFNYSNDYGVSWQRNDTRLDTGDIPGVHNSESPRISNDDKGHVYVTWYDERNENLDNDSDTPDIYFNYSVNFGETWQTSAIRLDTGDGPGENGSYAPRISSDRDGHVYVTWFDYRNGHNGDIYFNFSSDFGATWQASDTRLDTGDAPGSNRSWYPQISSDGNGNVYVTWDDYRAASFTDPYVSSDIYINFSSDFGETWQTSAIRLDTGDATGANRSDNPQISSDDNGHVYVTWEDYRAAGSTYPYNPDIYINYSSDFGVTWQTSDLRLDTGDVTGTHRSHNPQISSDDNGHVYVTWEDKRNSFFDIHSNYSYDYGKTWQMSDIKLDSDTSIVSGLGYSNNSQISSDGNGYVYVTWEDSRNGGIGKEDIYFNYSDDYGETWQARDIRINTGDAPGANRSTAPKISSDDNGHVYVIWEDSRNGGFEKEGIYFNYSDDSGATWKSSDTRLNSSTKRAMNPQISSDEKGHVYVIWEDYRDGYSDIYFNYSSDYGVTWQASDTRLDTGDAPGANSSYVPQISSDGNGHVYVIWEDYRHGNYSYLFKQPPYKYFPYPDPYRSYDYSSDIYFNYSSDYGVTWQASDIRLDSGDGPGVNVSYAPQISSDDKGHVYVIWGDIRSGDLDKYSIIPDIYFNYSEDYGVTWQSHDIRIDTRDRVGINYSYAPQICSDGDGHVYVVWKDGRRSSEINLKYSKDYGETWQSNEVRLDRGSGSVHYRSVPQISSDDDGHVYVTWVNSQSKNSYDSFANTHINLNYSDDNGDTWQTSDIRLDTGDAPGSNHSYAPRISSDGSGHVYVTWEDKRNAKIVYRRLEHYSHNTIYFNYFFIEGITNLNDSVSVNPIKSSYRWTLDTTDCPDGFVGKLSFDVEIKNSSVGPISDLAIQVGELTGRNILKISEGESGRKGGTLTLPEIGDYSDGEHGPGETIVVPFVIYLKEWNPFELFVDVLGIPGFLLTPGA